MRCAKVLADWRSRCSSKAWVRAPTAGLAAGRLAPSRIPIRSAGRCEGRDYGDDLTVKVPGEIDAQRARRILEELRRRFGESFRPQLELDYIERLLKDF